MLPTFQVPVASKARSDKLARSHKLAGPHMLAGSHKLVRYYKGGSFRALRES